MNMLIRYNVNHPIVGNAEVEIPAKIKKWLQVKKLLCMDVLNIYR